MEAGRGDRVAETDASLRLLGRVATRIHRLGHEDAVDAFAHARGHQREQVREARVHAAAEDRRPALLGGSSNARATFLAEPAAGDEARRRDDVDAAREDAFEFVDVRPERVVVHAVGRERQQCVDVVGRGDTERIDSAQFADVAAHLVGGVRETTDEFEAFLRDDPAHRLAAHVARRPLHDT